MKKGIDKEIMEYIDSECPYGFIAGMVQALETPKNSERKRIVWNAGYYRDMALQAVEGKKEQRAAAICALLCKFQNIAAGLCNDAFDREYVLETAEKTQKKWEGVEED